VTTLHVHLDEQRCTFRTGDGELVAPLGTGVLGAQISGDPPRADDLSNAIGAVHDALDDVVRELPDALGAALVEVTGPAIAAIADVEVGAPAVLPLDLDRDAAEDVFRTVATERRTDRGRNPGLAPEQVDAIVPAACVVVGIMRRLRVDRVRVVALASDDNGTP